MRLKTPLHTNDSDEVLCHLSPPHMWVIHACYIITCHMCVMQSYAMPSITSPYLDSNSRSCYLDMISFLFRGLGDHLNSFVASRVQCRTVRFRSKPHPPCCSHKRASPIFQAEMDLGCSRHPLYQVKDIWSGFAAKPRPNCYQLNPK